MHGTLMRELMLCLPSHLFSLDVSAFNIHNKMSPLWSVSGLKKKKKKPKI